MTPRLSHILLAAGLAIGLLGAVVFGVDAYRQHRGSEAEIQSAIHVGEANAHAGQAQAQDPKVAELKAIAARQAVDLGRLSAERDALLRKLASKPKPGADPAVGPAVGHDDSELSGISGELELLRATVEKDAEVIEGQHLLIKSQSELILVATKRGDEYKAAFEAERKARQAQEAATEAWKGAVKSAEWKGGLKGFAAGVALGYLGGKR